ncbi:unnamed protein product [Rotaria sp. Silwood1]|nr:unnamed protein product [Rotaria sp. Silwood1]CAF3803258.1 unnamed protein product [Rotaria sp. Silwood1]
MPIEDKNGKLLVNSADQLERWREYFCELLNVSSTVDPCVINEIKITTPSRSELERQNAQPSLEEVTRALNQMKSRKAPGSDEVTADILKAGDVPDCVHNATWTSNAHTVAGGRGAGPTSDRLHSPKGLCVNENQVVFIADALNHRIMKHYPGATGGIAIVGSITSGYACDRLCGPSSVVLRRRLESLFICDYHNRRVLQFKYRRCKGGKTVMRNKKCCRRSNGLDKYGKVVIDNVECCGLAVDDEGSLYISDTEHHAVKCYRAGDQHGTVVAGGNGQGSRPNQLNHPTYIFVGRDQSVYVSDTWNNRIMKWSNGATTGVVVAGGHGKGLCRTQLNFPAGLLVDQFGALYVADCWNHRVIRWYDGAP